MLSRLDLRGPDADPRVALAAAATPVDEPVGPVREIIDDVRRRGDAALRELTARFDGCTIEELRVPAADLHAALDGIDPELREALEVAAQRIRGYHEAQAEAQGPVRFDADGVAVEEVLRPVGRAGLYVPGGRAAYPSTVLMTAIPAVVAGVPEIALCVPPDRDGQVPPVTLAAAALAGVDRGLPGRWRTGDRRAGLRHRVDPGGRRHRRARERVREHREARGRGRRPGRDRVARGPLGARRRRRRARAARARRVGPRGAGRARTRRHRDPRHVDAAGCRRGRRRARRDRRGRSPARRDGDDARRRRSHRARPRRRRRR